MASPQHQREVSAGRQSVRSGAFLAMSSYVTRTPSGLSALSRYTPVVSIPL